jgi:hypothetical protein
MFGMKVRYQISDMNLKISNVTLPEAGKSYILITASDGKNNEIVFELSPEQAEHVENELYEANRRRKEHSSFTLSRYSEDDTKEQGFENHNDALSH